MRLKELREINGLSQKQLAEKVGYKSNTICRWERGERDPSSRNLIKLADLFNVSIDYLLERSDKR